MTDSAAADAVYAQIGKLRELAKSKHVDIPENPYMATSDISTALLASNGDEQSALKKIMAKFGRNKRSHASEKDLSNKKSKRGGENGGGDGGEAVAAGYAYSTMTKGEKEIAGGAGHVGIKAEDRKQAGQDPGGEEQGDQDKRDREESMAPHKTIRLVEEAREQKAANSANQKIVDALANYGEEQLDRGHTGKGVSHLRAAIHIRDHPDAITSAKEARAVPMVGNKLASQIEEILSTGKVKDDTADQNVSTNVGQHQRPQLVNDIFNSKAKCPENQVLVDELAKFGEHELYFGSSGKGTSHLRAAREIQLADHVVKSGSTARTSIPLVGDIIADKIDQIMEHGRIVQDTGETTGSKSYSRGSGGGYTVAPIVQDLRDKPAQCPENQRIVDALIDYGDSHLYSGHRGKGISHLRAAQHIRDSKTVVKSGRQASKDIDMVGQRVAAKIDQILEQGHADSDEDYEYDPEDEEEGEEEYGARERDSVVPPIVQDVCSKRAQVEKNQVLVDALVEYGEEELYKRHTGRGTAFLRAARRLRDADVEVNSGKDVKSIGVGDKIAKYIDTILAV